MMPTRNGALKLFELRGISVFIHWSWFLVALYEVNVRKGRYQFIGWNLAEYLTLFAIVLMHEFGHALACRQVGGRADQIVLWPLGGVAYVAPPPRPGAQLWSIAAGPLVNVALLPITFGAVWFMGRMGWRYELPDLYHFVRQVTLMNVILLGFNMLPAYPLDGGQILQSLLWFAMGRARSLMVSTVIGFIAGLGLVGVAIWLQSFWIGITAFFLLSRCVAGFKLSRKMAVAYAAPRRSGFACPACHEAPRIGAIWICASCQTPFDTFETSAICPNCHAHFDATVCPECHRLSPMSEWVKAAPPVPQS